MKTYADLNLKIRGLRRERARLRVIRNSGRLEKHRENFKKSLKENKDA